jgi:WD40 repeat protein
LIATSPNGSLVATAYDRYPGELTDVWNLAERAKSTEAKPQGSYLIVSSGKQYFFGVQFAKGGIEVDDLIANREALFLSNADMGTTFTEGSFSHGLEGSFFSDEGRYFVIAGEVWEVSSHRRIKLPDAVPQFNPACFSTDSRYVAGWSKDGTINVVDLMKMQVVTNLNAPDDEERSRLAFSPNGRYLAAERNGIRIWDTHLPGDRAEIFSAFEIGMDAEGFTADSAYFVGKNALDQVFSVNLASRVKTVFKEEGYSRVVISPSEPVIAIAWKNTVELWDLRSGRLRSSLDHFGVQSEAFSADGRYLATGGDDGLISVWQSLTGREIARVKHAGSVSKIIFSGQGNYLMAQAGGNSDGSVFVSPLRPQELTGDACARIGRSLTRKEWGRYLGSVSYRETCSQ